MPENPVYILGIESSCDETAAAVARDNTVLSNIIANQAVHKAYGGIVPELASRAHQKHIVPVVDQALRRAGIRKDMIDAVAFTNGPGLIGALMVGSAFARTFALSMGKPVIGVNHLHAHVLAHFARLGGEDGNSPNFPFLCLTVSGGHTQIVKVNSHHDLDIIGQTQDDAAGEAFDKVAKILGLPYPGGPLVDKLAAGGNHEAFEFPQPRMPGLDFSFSGLKTAVLYFVERQQSKETFVRERITDLCASIQHTIVTILMNKMEKAAAQTGISEIALAGGVSANRGLRKALDIMGKKNGWNTYVPPLELCTDNAAMIAVTGYYRYLDGEFSETDEAPFARFERF